MEGGPTKNARQRAIRGILLIVILAAARLWVADHPIPYHGDEVGFLRGLGFPAPYPVHHPGYPLWVGMGMLLRGAGVSPYASFEIWSVLGSLLAPLMLYAGLRWVVADGLAWWTALAFGVNPLIWFLSATALNYTCAVALGMLIVGLSWRALRGEARAIRQAAWVMAVCIWLRPDYLAWLGPLMLWPMWRLRRQGSWRVIAPIFTSFIGVVVVAWILYGRGAVESPPMEQARLWRDSLLNTSVFRLGLVDGFMRSLAKLAGILAWVFGLSGVALLVGLVFVGRIHAKWSESIRFLLLWVSPLTAFVLLIHMTEPGHVILLVPAGYVATALLLHVCLRWDHALRAASALALCSAIQFAAYPWSIHSTGFKRTLDAKIAYLSAAGLRQIDRRWDIHTPSDVWPTAIHKPTASRPALP